MHEISIAAEVFRVIERAVGGRVPLAAIEMEVGSFSGVAQESLRFCLESAARDQGFGRPEIRIRSVGPATTCLDCGRSGDPAGLYTHCPDCGSPRRELSSGMECVVVCVEIDDETSDASSSAARDTGPDRPSPNAVPAG